MSTAFDIIGDVHGCADELQTLLNHLGYEEDGASGWRGPEARKAIFIGDLVDRGPRNIAALEIAMAMVNHASALWVIGNHDLQLQRHLEGEDVPLLYGFDVTVEELKGTSPTFRSDALAVLQSLPSHYVLDEGRLVVAHAGLPEELHGQPDTPDLRYLSAFGIRPGSPDPTDWTKRHAWVTGYGGQAAVVHGHTPVRDAVWRHNVIDIDTGCVYGGRLTALRWPERELVCVTPVRTYARGPHYF